MSRVVSTSTLVFDQVAFRALDGTRIASVTLNQIVFRAFLNGSAQSWTLTAGTGVQNSSISSGRVYFQEISGNPGFYSTRIFIPAPGFWTFSFQYSPIPQEVLFNYDASSSSVDCSSGITASFT